MCSRYRDRSQHINHVAAPTVEPAEECSAMSNSVQVYTHYYHKWQANAKQHESHANSLPEGSSARVKALRHAEWAKYYAGQSSRAAHHFYNHPATPAPFDLPPSPPPITAARWQPSCGIIANEENSGVDRLASASNGNYEAPDSLKRYVRRCLRQCETDVQRKAVQSELEKVIAQAVRSGSLQSTDWNTAASIKPTIALTTSPRPPIADASLHKQKPPNRSDPVSEHYIGRTSGCVGNASNNKSYYNQSTSPTNVSRKFDDTFSSSPSDFSHQKKRNREHSDNGNKREAKKHKSASDSVQSSDADYTMAVVSVRSNLGSMTVSTRALKKRAERFSVSTAGPAVATEAVAGFGRCMGKGSTGNSDKHLDDSDDEKAALKGTCERLEKDYLRLTAPPRAELVRPRRVLKQHLKMLKMEWKQKERRDYVWFCSQLKAVRQDCTVQRIQGAFTVDVYETHARIALEEGDMNEYNQCQTQLKYLYEKLKDFPVVVRNKNEFAAYLIIYNVCLTVNRKYDGGSSDLFKIMLSLTPEERGDSAISHALKVQTAVADADYHGFFCLRNTCPNSGRYLMNLIVPHMRSMALRRICKAYRPSVDISFVLGELGFGKEELALGVDWLSGRGCVMSPEGGKLLTKACRVCSDDGK